MASLAEALYDVVTDGSGLALQPRMPGRETSAKGRL